MDEIYFIQAETETGLIKIGMTSGISEQRMKSLQRMSPVKLKILFSFSTPYGYASTRDYESFLHDLFADFRQHGEWFFPVRSLNDFISFLKEMSNKEPTVILWDYWMDSFKQRHPSLFEGSKALRVWERDFQNEVTNISIAYSITKEESEMILRNRVRSERG